MMGQGKYPFLEILKEQEAIARGANLSDKVTHAVYKAIKNLSSADSAKKNLLFTLNTNVPEILNLTKKDLQQVVQRLMGERLVTQLFRIEFDPASGATRILSCFVTQPPAERESLLQIYSEVNEQSLRTMETFLSTRAAMSSDAAWADLETDLAATRVPESAALPGTLVDLFSGIHASKFDVLPAPELISATIREIEDELIFRGKVVRIVDYGFLPVRDLEILDRFELTSDFFTAKVIPLYMNRGTVKRDLEQIQIEEGVYRADPFAAPTSEFASRKAVLLKNAVVATLQTRGQGARYPGALAVEILIMLEQRARTKYQERARAEQMERHQAFKKKLVHSATWTDAIRFVTEEEASSMPPDAWNRLLADHDLIQGLWEDISGTVHVFVRNDQSAFRILVRGMADLPGSLQWQVLAMKLLLEKYEDRFRELFEDPEFVRSYGQLLRQVYMDFIPWYHRFLLQFGILWFQDRAFSYAKAAIGKTQENRAVRNKEKSKAEAARREEEKKTKTKDLQNLASVNQVFAALDNLYLGQSRIPTITEVRALCPDVPLEGFVDFLREEGFQLVGGGASLEESLVLYPLNQEWRTRAPRLRRVMDKIQVSGSGNDQERLKRLRKFLARLERAAASDAPPEKDEDDPYEKFGKEMKKQKARDKAASAAPMPANPDAGNDVEF